MNDLDPISLNISGVQQLVGSKLNKINSGASTQIEGKVGEEIDVFELKMSDDDLKILANAWTAKYRLYEGNLKPRQNANKTFYLGRQKEGGPNVVGEPISSNLLFEAEETFLPAALSKNPEPVVWSDNTAEGTKLSNAVKTMLQYHADTLVLRRKLTLVTRHWSIYFIGIMKHGWDDVIKDIKSEVRDPRNFIFDPDGFVDCYGDYEGYLGERITVTADKLAILFPKHKDYITIIVDGKMGTSVTYTEWWTDDYCFYTFNEIVLDKSKNPHFNLDTTKSVKDLDGIDTDQTTKGKNHFARPKKPYTFLSVFSLGEQPHDITGLIEQNIPNQRRITRRTEQLDYNLSRANNSDIFSQTNFTEETAKQAATAMAKGNPILVPSGGPINEAVHRLAAPNIGGEFFKELEVSKTDLRSIFGTQGISSQQPNENTTARGMILNEQFDNTRIGGGIGDALEQVADNIFNWWVQLYYVYYDEEHDARILGQMKAVEYVTLQSSDFIGRVVVSVSPDSMKPKDEVSEANQAISLFESEAIDPKTLLTVLNFPDPQNTAAQGALWKTNPQAYMALNFPELMQKLQAVQQQGQQGGAPPQQGAPAQPTGGTPTPSLAATPASPALQQVPLT